MKTFLPIEQIYERIKKDGAFLSLYLEGMSILYRSGILKFLEERAKPLPVDGGKNPQTLTFEAGRSIGYNEALEDLLYFKEKYLSIPTTPEKLEFDFGGKDILKQKGDLTEGELDGTSELAATDISAWQPGQPIVPSSNS